MIRRLIVAVLAVAGLVVGGAAVAGAQYTPGQPGFIITPSTTPPGGIITAIGFGCGRNEQVVIAINGETVATTISSNDSQGSFQVDFTAPTTPGTYTVTATCGNIVQSSILTVQAAATTITSGGLPVTGSDSTWPLVRLGFGLLAAGGLVLILTRRRRQQHA